ncbi:hypothetical protein SDC9_130918 [bioreactor metagenome]|uniref:Uncharacterized protein n=1 Tax=bioreactor metagenome TaxID=1076179 RepID=A0A645D3S2_9ZZZZ
MPGPVAISHHLGKLGFVELGIVKGDRAGIDRLLTQPGHGRNHCAGVHAA